MSHSDHVSLSPYALLTPQETRVMDEKAKNSLKDLMAYAGLMVARLIRQHFRPCRVVVACGPGNNGGDGYVAARHLQAWGWPVAVAALARPREGSLAEQAAQQWTGPIVPFTSEEAQRAGLVVDAVFGAGMSRDLPQEVEVFLSASSHIVAIDLPSGLHGETGEMMGDVAPCEMTIAFVRRRPAHLLHPGAALCGQSICVDITMPTSSLEAVQPRYWENNPGLWKLPTQHSQDHKYSRGVVSLCGGATMPGAALLSAEAARRVGAGLVRMTVAQQAENFYRIAAPGVIIESLEGVAILDDARRHVWVCGPGLTPDEVGCVLPMLLKGQRHVVGDAGALGWAVGDPDRLKGVSVITPHLGEFTRLFGQPKKDRVASVRAVAHRLNSVVVLKGADTLIVAPDGRVVINRHASAALATAGSGDVLSGVIATFIAAGMDAFMASCAGVWVHGEAGYQAATERGGWPIAEDLVSVLGKAREMAEK
ncbi:NAD(P)H-hydrate dehydratase [Saccharibacter sp. 17.LH.SD]|uniref:NAD(P)H-hydrate dehydratase n=1 Tax=Saccharibacter sp. 17.LH.SD TaxID=2689393 RepID=UPI00136BE1FE|nr:NAD(P)H-hydrate dehydratase [Saccharibacter sp. 17.LH.SD]MXV44603.1 NAD(P)H-hydrate dehydratase [Saccharibacter sp. 17.LH.SD]